MSSAIDELWANAREVIRGVIADAAIDPSGIAAIGCAGHGNGLYLLDRSGGPLLGIQSLDTRAAGLAARMAAESGEALHALCLQKPWPSQTRTLLAWVKANRPETYAQAGTAMLCKDFVTFRLTGERVSDISDMSGAGLLRMPDCAYDAGLMDGSRSAHWPRIFADGLGLPVTVAEARETGALGAAIGAGVGAGLFGDYEQGIAAMVRPGVTFDPDPAARAHYERRYGLYNQLTAALGPFWAGLAEN